jgi:uncharacterized protein
VRLLLLILLVVVAVWLFRRALLRASGGRRDDKDVAQKPPVEGELVSCARCGLNLPRGEARELEGRLFCSDEHARLGSGPGGR